MANHRKRSPHYPSVDLEASIEKVALIVQSYNTAEVDRDALAKAMNYSGLSGSSAPVIGALVQFGLLEYVHKGEARATDLATRIIWAESEDEKSRAVREAALRPGVFKKLYEKFGTEVSAIEGVRNHLRRMNFAEKAAKAAAEAYLKTIRFARLESDNESQENDTEMLENASTSNSDLERIAMQPTTRSFEFNDWMRLPIDEGVTVRIQTNTKHDLQPEQLKYLLEVLELKLKNSNPTDNSPEG